MYLRVIDSWYTVEDGGYKNKEPIVHFIGRDKRWERHYIRVESFYPYFCVPESEYVDCATELQADDRVLSVETEDIRGRPETDLDGNQLVRIVCREPSDVGDLREVFDDPYEADVLFPVRFLVDVDAYQWIEVPDVAVVGDAPTDFEDVTLELDDETIPDETPPPRVVSYDIEVEQGGSGPAVVSTEGTEQARNPITAITAHDSYTDEYRVWVLLHDEWDSHDSQAARNAVDCEVSVYRNPADVVAQFCDFVIERDADVLTAWSGSGFDHPYLVNWGIEHDVGSVYRLSPTRDVYPMDGDGRFINSSLKGRLLLDSLSLYEKTSVHELDSYRLEDVAEAEDVSVGKLAIGEQVDVPEGEPAIDYAWEHDPETFVKYSLRDVKATVAINRESKENVNII